MYFSTFLGSHLEYLDNISFILKKYERNRKEENAKIVTIESKTCKKKTFVPEVYGNITTIYLALGTR